MFARRLKKAREHANMTQAELAEEIGLADCRSYQNYESKSANNIRVPNLETIVKIAKILDCDVTYLTGENEETVYRKDIAEVEDTTGLSEEAVKMLEYWNNKIDIPNKFFNPSEGYGEMFALNFLLEDMHNELTIAREQKRPVNYGNCIFSHISKYLYSEHFREAEPNRIRYRHDDRKFDDINEGDTITHNGESHTIQSLYAHNKNYAKNWETDYDKITFYNEQKDDEAYTVSFQKLVTEYWRQAIIKDLDLLKEKIDEN
jgi:transcriptional regulator with XRE-family HTH domain